MVNYCSECYFEIGDNSKRCIGCHLRVMRLLKSQTHKTMKSQTPYYYSMDDV